MARSSEPFWAQKRDGEVDQQPGGHQGGKRIVSDMEAPLEAVAGKGVTDRDSKKG